MNISLDSIRKAQSILVLSLLLALLIFSGAFFIVRMYNNEIADFEKMLGNVSRNNANAVEVTFTKYINLLKTAALCVQYPEQNQVFFHKTLVDLVKFEDFSHIATVYPNNSAYITQNNTFIPADYTFNKQMNTKKIFISNVYTDKYSTKPSISINIPVFDDDGMLHLYIVGVITTETLSNIFNKIFYNVGGYYNIVDSNGAYIAASDSELLLLMDISFITAIDTVDLLAGYSREAVRNAFTLRTEGLVHYRLNDNERVAYYSPIHINNWIIFSVVPDDVITTNLASDFHTTIILVVNIVFIFCVLIFLVYRSQRALKKSAETNEKNIRFVSEQINKYILEWDFITGRIKITGKLKEIFNQNNNIFSTNQSVLNSFLFAEDIPIFQQAINELKKGNQASEIKIRIACNNGDFLWFLFSAVPIATDDQDRLYDKAIGFLTNIDKQEKEAHLLKKMSELDSLTQIYNKGTTELLINKILDQSNEKTNMHACIIIDLDNFKEINDTFGHQFGDHVIQETAEYLKSIFRQNDIVGRIGGDEFLVFVCNAYSEQIVTDKFLHLLKHFDKNYKNDEKSVKISISIGVAVYPTHGNTFTALYHNADMALYDAKQHGKNTFKIFNGQETIEYISDRSDKESQ